MSAANPAVAPSSTNTWINGLKWGQYWDTAGTGEITYMIANSVTVDFGGTDVNALTPYAEEVSAIEDILQNIENIINISFVATTDLADADIVFASVGDADASGYLGISLPPGEYYNPAIHDWQSVVIVNRDAYSMNGGTPDGLNPGGYDYITWLHELGHDLGLAHPHDNGGTSTIFPGVRSAFNSYGSYNMNQGIFTTMTYNDGWVAGTGARGSSGVYQYGWQATMMALDVATLQFLYGANTSFANGDDTYTLDDENGIGAGYQCIWDTGGNDTLAYDGSRNVTLDLRAATLANAAGGGGFVSYVNSGSIIYNGFTIANHVVIENAGGGDGNDTLIGNAASNSLDGGAGADSMTGGKGDDTYFVDNILDKVVELANEGLDVVHAAINWILGANVENLFLEDTALSGTGNGSVNALYGNDGANILDGKAGADQLYGFDGNDTYVVGSSGDQIFEVADEGTDTAMSSASYTLGDNVENLTLTGTAAINGTGNGLANIITGNTAANVIDGGAGADSMAGGLGNDTYVVDDAGDSIIEALSAGTDLVKSFIGYSLVGSNLENLTLLGSDNIDATGNALANTLTGNSGNNRLDGGAGTDTMTGGLGDDTYVVEVSGDKVTELAGAGTGTDTIETALATYSLSALTAIENLTYTGIANFTGTGNALANSITGGSGNDILNGGIAADRLIGGAGSDTYVVDNAGDIVDEFSGTGTDLVQSSVSFDLSDGAHALGDAEKLTLTGSSAINGTGNDLANTITGNGGANIIEGKGGADILDGGAGLDTVSYAHAATAVTVVLGGASLTTGNGEFGENDSLKNFENIIGSAAADNLTGDGAANIINGGAGADTMAGGLGNDTYVVDNSGDIVDESAGSGTDLVQSSISFDLSDGIHVLGAVENLTLTGSGNIDATGNALANVLTGNSGNNRLDGGAGTDTMTGGLGDDTYVVDVSGDKVTELAGAGTGTDTIETALATYSLSALTAVENLTYTGIANFTGTGNALANSITGGSGNDILNGGTAADRLIGGAGSDTYVVDNAGDIVDEFSGTGTDLVQSSVSFDLSDGAHALGDVEKLTLTGSSAINGTGNDLANTITGNGGANIIEGKGGADILDGGAGLDTVSYAHAATAVTVVLGGASLTTGNGEFGENDSLKNFENIIGSAAADNLTGDGAANIINGGAGADTMAGGLGNDTYVVDNSGDIVDESAGSGTDLVQSSISFDLSDGVHVLGAVENLTLTGSDNIDATGNALANVLTGNSGNNRLDGGAGTDTMTGGLGDDTYVVDVSGDKVTELAGAGTGTDTIETALATYSLSALTAVENLTYTGIANFTGTGNALANVIHGGTGNDTLNGGAGTDSLTGGNGDDTYVVDNILDTVSEFFDSGNDLVQASVNFVLSADVERLTLTGSAAINGTGNDLANTITGNGGANVIEGKGGADILDGGAGTDTLSYASSAEGVTVALNGATITFGSGGDAQGDSIKNFENITGSAAADSLMGNGAANVIDGGAGADTMAGGLGNDTYVVDDAGDIIIEALSAGTDLVKSFIGYSLGGSNLENLTLLGSDNIDATGNALANTLTGNSGNNRLDGGAGTDTMTGGLGDDTYVVEVSGDKVTELAGQGTDTIETALASFSLAKLTAIENLTYTGGFNFSGTGNALANSITGGSGNDSFTGGAGGDTFVFNVAAFGDDKITDYQDGLDKLSFTAAIADSFDDFTIAGNGTKSVTISHGLDSIILTSSTAFTLDASDFIFV